MPAVIESHAIRRWRSARPRAVCQHVTVANEHTVRISMSVAIAAAVAWPRDASRTRITTVWRIVAATTSTIQRRRRGLRGCRWPSISTS